MSKKTSIISVQDISVTIASFQEDDYICITDMAKAKSGESRAADVIKNWIETARYLKSLSIYEKLRCNRIRDRAGDFSVNFSI